MFESINMLFFLLQYTNNVDNWDETLLINSKSKFINAGNSFYILL
jgi:hypothetical protein